MPTAEYEALVEKVALGLANAERGNNAAFHLEWINNGPSDDVYRFRARAAIATIYAAMRAPSEEMTTAANDSHLLLTYGMAHDAIVAAIAASPLNPEARNAD